MTHFKFTIAILDRWTWRDDDSSSYGFHFSLRLKISREARKGGLEAPFLFSTIGGQVDCQEQDWLPALDPLSDAHVLNRFHVSHCGGCRVEPAHGIRGERAGSRRGRLIAGASQRADVIHLRSCAGGTRVCARLSLAARRVYAQGITNPRHSRTCARSIGCHKSWLADSCQRAAASGRHRRTFISSLPGTRCFARGFPVCRRFSRFAPPVGRNPTGFGL